MPETVPISLRYNICSECTKKNEGIDIDSITDVTDNDTLLGPSETSSLSTSTETEANDSFRYLGHDFDFHMSNQVHKIELSNLVASTLNIIDSFPLHPNSKLLSYNRYFLSKIPWRFTVCDLSKTWIVEHLDCTASHYIRKWLDLSISSTLRNILLPREKFGLDIILPSTKFAHCQTVHCNALESSH